MPGLPCRNDGIGSKPGNDRVDFRTAQDIDDGDPFDLLETGREKDQGANSCGGGGWRMRGHRGEDPAAARGKFLIADHRHGDVL